MTREERVLIQADDLKEIELACAYPGCGVRVSYTLGDKLDPADRCPGCRNDWFEQGDPNKQALAMLSQTLRHLRKMPENRFALRFRVHGKSVEE